MKVDNKLDFYNRWTFPFKNFEFDENCAFVNVITNMKPPRTLFTLKQRWRDSNREKESQRNRVNRILIAIRIRFLLLNESRFENRIPYNQRIAHSRFPLSRFSTSKESIKFPTLKANKIAHSPSSRRPAF